MSLIAISRLKRYYRMGDSVVKALDGVDLSIKQGEFLCLMGPSGSGKSTLLNLIGGLDRSDEGQIIVNGQDITALDEDGLAAHRQQQVGYIFQSFNLIATMTALQNVEYPLIFAGIPVQQRHERALALLDRLGLKDRVHHKPTELSGGQQQRVAIARGLVNSPTILMGDEPTGNLDSKTGEEILEMLRELNQAGQTIILVTHDPRVTAYASRTISMLDGLIVEEAHNHAPI
jgi:putative ABC transport system ATP-binding protein